MAAEPASSVLRSVSWRDLCPWLLLLRTFSVAISPSVLLAGTIGAAALPLGWRLADNIFLPAADAASGDMASVRLAWQPLPGGRPDLQDRNRGAVDRWLGPLVRLYSRVDMLGRQLLSHLRRLDLRRSGYLLTGAAWTLLVAGLVGGAITRKAVVALGREERESMSDALAHARRRLGGYVMAPLYPLVVMGILAAGAALLGTLARVDALAVIGALAWALVLLAGAAAAVLLIGVAIAWPLMWGAVSAEEDGEAFEALSRAYSYLFGRPLQLLFYVLVAALVGALGLVVVGFAVQLTVDLATNAADWGAGGAISDLTSEPHGNWMRTFAGNAIRWQNRAVLAAAAGYQFAFFWVAAGAVYLLIRSDVDHTELDEVYMPDENEPLSLPSLQLDASGAVAVRPEPSKSPAEPPPQESDAAGGSQPAQGEDDDAAGGSR